jgi:hypothetical protein
MGETHGLAEIDAKQTIHTIFPLSAALLFASCNLFSGNEHEGRDGRAAMCGPVLLLANPRDSFPWGASVISQISGHGSFFFSSGRRAGRQYMSMENRAREDSRAVRLCPSHRLLFCARTWCSRLGKGASVRGRGWVSASAFRLR